MHYYQHNIGDYRRDTTHLSLLEHGVYRQLLDQYYLNEFPLPSDESKLYRLICARSEQEIEAVKNVLADFFELETDGWVHKRCEEELLFYQNRLEQASKAGRKSAEKRANFNKSSTDVQQMFNDCSTEAQLKVNSSSTQAQLTNNLITNNLITNINPIGDFETFWKAYPKKVGKNASLKAWNKAKPNIDDCLKALSWQTKTSQWFKNNGQFVPNPATWINQHRWEDEPTSEASF